MKSALSSIPLMVALGCLPACGEQDSPKDPCALTACGTACVDTSSDEQYCGGCSLACAPAADCKEGGCTCPKGLIPAAPTFFRDMMRADVPQARGLMTGIGLLSEAGSINALMVAFDPATVPVGIDVDLATVNARKDTVYVGLGFEVDLLMDVRSAFLATAGTLRLTRACAEGVAGTLTHAMLQEIDLFADLTAPIAGGCASSVPSVAFTIGQDCPPR